MARNKTNNVAPFITQKMLGRIWPNQHYTPEQAELMKKRKSQRWPEQGVCQGHEDPELWTAEKTRDKQADHVRNEQAKQICIEECPVVVECLEFAIGMNEPGMIWGGMDPQERQAARRRQLRRRTG